MKIFLVNLLAMVSVNFMVGQAWADETPLTEMEIEVFQGEDAELIASIFSNPPGSKWISVRCGTRSVCYPPAGYKFRHFNVEKRGSDCKGSQKRRTKLTKDYISTSRECRVIGRVFIWPAEYCKGNFKNCSSK